MTRRSGWCWPGCWCRPRSFTGSRTPPPGAKAAPVSDWELASRLSYFLWSSMPDDELRAAAASGQSACDRDVLAAQARRMFKDPRIRRLATEFACQWLHIYDFDSLDEKSQRHFPTFARAAKARCMKRRFFFHGPVSKRRFGALGFRRRSYVLERRSGEALRHSGRRGPRVAASGRSQQVRPRGNPGPGGDAGKAVGRLAHQPDSAGQLGVGSPAGRAAAPTAQERPACCPDDEAATQGLTVRQLVERHTSDPRCASCHVAHRRVRLCARGLRRDRPPPRSRPGRPADRHSLALRDGTEFDGLDGLRHYLVTTRRDAFIRQFCRKLLGYALGRGIQLSDRPLLEEMERALKKNDYRLSAALRVRRRQPSVPRDSRQGCKRLMNQACPPVEDR